MIKVTVIDNHGVRHELETDPVMTLKDLAVINDVPGIVARCGGSLACATCHVYIDTDWIDVIGKPEEMEEDMLDMAWDVKPNSRLSCQIMLRDEHNGLIVHVPERQE